MKKITLLFCLTLLTNIMVGQCLTATSSTPQYPTTSYVPATCDGITSNSITTVGYASEYSAVTVTLGQTYTFTSSTATDLITISADAGATAATSGIGSVTWVSTIAGDVYFYTHLNDGACGAENVSRTRSVICGIPPTCIAPTALTISNITTSSATVSWTASVTSADNGYEFYYSTDNTNPPTDTTTPSGNVGAGILTTDLSGLSDSTIYYVWVRSVCSASDTSGWSLVKSFTTLCLAVTDFTENFDVAVAFPSCWAKVGTGGSSNVQASASATSSPNVLYIYSSSATSQAVVSMRPVSNAGDGTHRLRFRARGNYTLGGNIEVGYLTNPTDATSFVGIQTFTTTNTNVYDAFTAYLGVSPGTNQVLAFRHTGTPGYSVLIDDVVWEAVPSCVEPTAIATSNVTTNSATITWTASTSTPANGYEYYVSTSNVAPIATTTPTGSVAAGITTADLSGLSDSSIYYVWIRSVCSSSDSSVWSSVATFTTPCLSLSSFPWTENFDSMPTIGAGIVPTCWTNITGTKAWTSSNTASTTFNAPNSAPNYMRIAYSNTVASSLWTPGFSLNAGQSYDFSFYYNTNGTTSSYIGFTGNVLVNTSASASGASDLGPFITSTQGTSAYTLYTVSYTPTASGTYYFALNVSATSAPWYLGVDDFKLDLTPLSNNLFTSNNFSFYPNPVKDILNISFSKTISQVNIYNIVGQEVAVKSINDTQSQIDMSNLSRGTYVVKITSEGLTQTIKVLKD